MIEQGLKDLVQSDTAVHALCSVGGFLGQLPPNYKDLPTWTHTAITEPVNYALRGGVTLRMRRIQIDVYGKSAANVLALASAIDAVLSGFKGTLSDPDATRVAGCFRSNLIDFFDDGARSWRRLLEYGVWFYQN